MRRGFRLKHLNPSGRFPSGNVRYYYRPKGQKGVKLPDLPMDHPEFLAAYAAAAGVTPKRPTRTGSLGGAIEAYKRSDAFLTLAAGTRSVRARALDKLSKEYGHANLADLRKRHVEADLGKLAGHARNNRLKVWRGFGMWVAEAMHLPDPTDGLRKVRTPRSDGHIPWTRKEIETFRAYWPIGSMERLAFEVIYWTGARVSDAVRLGEGNVDADGWLVFNQQKTGGRVDIPLRRALPEFAERFSDDLAYLLSAIQSRNERHLTWLHTQHGASRSQKAVSQWFAAKARRAGITGRTAHGLRKSRAIALVEAQGTTSQVGAWTGHESLKEIERYTRGFNKRRALSRTDEEQKVPTSENEFQNRLKKQGISNG